MPSIKYATEEAKIRAELMEAMAKAELAKKKAQMTGAAKIQDMLEGRELERKMAEIGMKEAGALAKQGGGQPKAPEMPDVDLMGGIKFDTASQEQRLGDSTFAKMVATGAKGGPQVIQQAKSGGGQQQGPYQAPSTITSQTTQGGISGQRTGPSEITMVPNFQQQTTTRENALTAGQAGQLNQNRQLAEAKLLREQMTVHAKDLGLSMHTDPSEVKSKVQELMKKYGPKVTMGIMSEAQREAEKLDFEQKKADLASRRIEGRSERSEDRKAKRKAGEPTKAIERRDVILGKIAEDKPITKSERKFLDEYARTSPMQAAIRDALSGAGEKPQVATPADDANMAKLYFETYGKEPTGPELRGFMESKGFTSPLR